MAEKAKTAQRGQKADPSQHICPKCEAPMRVVQFAGFGKKGFYWVCEKNAEYAFPTSSVRGS